MFIDLHPSEFYSELTQNLKSQWPFDLTGVDLRLYQTPEHAISEISQGLVQMYGHRNEVFFFKGLSPYYRRPMLQLAKRGLFIRELHFAEFIDPSALENQLGRSTLLLILNVDDPLTGEILPVEPVLNMVQGRNIFSISMSHCLHLYQKPQLRPGPYDINLYTFPGVGVIALLGVRARGITDEGPFLNWGKDKSQSLFFLPALHEQDRIFIEELEEKGIADSQLLLAPGQPRICDRLVLTWQDLDGASLREELARLLLIQNSEWNLKEGIETASLCRWNSMNYTLWLEERGVSASQRRGLMVVATEVAKLNGFVDFLTQAVVNIRRQQLITI